MIHDPKARRAIKISVLCLAVVVALVVSFRTERELLLPYDDDPWTWTTFFLEQPQQALSSRTNHGHGKQEMIFLQKEETNNQNQSKPTKNTALNHATVFNDNHNTSCYPFNNPVTPVILSQAAKEMIKAIPPRAFPYRSNNNASSLPCFPPNHPERTLVSTTGLLLLKPKKVGSTTAASVHMRMARNAAHRIHMSGKNNTNTNDPFPMCDMVWNHAIARNKFSNSRNVEQSVLWTILRHPVTRLVSYFQYKYVGRQHVHATAANFQKYIVENGSYEVPHYYLNVVSPRPINDVKGRQVRPGIDNTTNLIEGILYDYDFVAITERMDESLVAMSILWNVPLGDILHMSSKVHGGYDSLGGTCRKIPNVMALIPQNEMQKLVSSPEFQALIEWDAVAYKLANDSLDKTIYETIGREKFNLVLNQFRQAQQRVLEICKDEVGTPCSGGGLLPPRPGGKGCRIRPDPTTDCIIGDKGCGFMCLDDVATELNLWGSHGPLSYQFPRAFGQGPSTKKRLASKEIRAQ